MNCKRLISLVLQLMVTLYTQKTPKGKFYQLQKNNTLHLVEVSTNGGKKYIPFIPNLQIPTIKSHHKKVLEVRRDSKSVQSGTPMW